MPPEAMNLVEIVMKVLSITRESNPGRLGGDAVPTIMYEMTEYSGLLT